MADLSWLEVVAIRCERLHLLVKCPTLHLAVSLILAGHLDFLPCYSPASYKCASGLIAFSHDF